MVHETGEWMIIELLHETGEVMILELLLVLVNLLDKFTVVLVQQLPPRLPDVVGVLRFAAHPCAFGKLVELLEVICV